MQNRLKRCLRLFSHRDCCCLPSEVGRWKPAIEGAAQGPTAKPHSDNDCASREERGQDITAPFKEYTRSESFINARSMQEA